jgi:hypothetical protein
MSTMGDEERIELDAGPGGDGFSELVDVLTGGLVGLWRANAFVEQDSRFRMNLANANSVSINGYDG